MCPVCRQPMVAYELDGVEIDRCLSCGGTWLDAGELEMLIEQAGARAGELTLALGEAQRDRRTRRSCPRCPRRLHELRVGDEAPVVLDTCPTGHGLWLDAGEMKTLVHVYTKGESGVVARYFSDLYHDEFEARQEGEPT